jgi:hypothetical protein
MKTVISQRERVILETDRKKKNKDKKANEANATSDGENGRREGDPGDADGDPDRDAEDSDSEEGLAALRSLNLEPSAEAIAKLTDYGECCAVPNKIYLLSFTCFVS